MKRLLIASILMVLALSVSAMAAITEQEAAQLGGPTLTPFGAEKTGSKDGLVSAWTGGITKGAEGWYFEGKLLVPFSKFDQKKSGNRPDPFANDKPLFTVTAQNMSQYADRLSEGFKAILTKYPNVKLNVYPCRRSMSYAQSAIDGTKKSAVTAQLTDGGVRLQGAHCGIPFPIPKNGTECIWNHLVRWTVPLLETMHYKAYMITSNGRAINTTEGYGTLQSPYWIPDSSERYRALLVFANNIGPANRVGEGTMYYTVTDYRTPMPVWSYLPGQRRVKLAPQLTFDTPNTETAGASTSDDTYMFVGSPERYNWKLIGKKEMIVPYNNYRATYWSKEQDLLKPNFINTDLERYEVHRTWVVEATLKPGARHIYKKRVFYIDEDSWQAMTTDQYDNSDKLYRMGWLEVVFNYDVQGPTMQNGFTKDLVTGIYCTQSQVAERGGYIYKPNLADDQWNPQIMAGRGIR